MNLPLPRFTFILADQPQYDFGQALAKTSPKSTLWSLRSPLEEASSTIFTALATTDIEDALRERHSDILGRQALVMILAIDVPLQLIFPDCTDPRDIDPFITRFGRDQILCLGVGPLRLLPTGCRHIWLPMLQDNKRLDFLRHELDAPERRTV